MEQLAATGDTWGVPGPTFLIFYVALIVLVAIVAAAHRRALFAGDRTAQVDRLGPQQIAYLNGGDQLALYASLGGLRAAEAIASATDKTLSQAGPLPSGATALDTAVYNAAGNRIRAREVRADRWVAAALEQLRTGLEQAGLVVTADRQKAARRWALAGLALILLGVARLVDGLQNGKPVTFLLFAIFLAVAVTLRFWRHKPQRTRAATKGLSSVRGNYDYLSPSQSPSYATYGASGAAMGVALFGTASLYTMDPAFAAEAEVQRNNVGGGFDGGSGSSCSSGSSCGGGGGCGGGGCGG